MQATPPLKPHTKEKPPHYSGPSKWPALASITCKLLTDFAFQFSPWVSEKMTVSADVRFSLSAAAAGQLHGARGLGVRRYCSRLVKFGNGELMGNKLKLNQLHQGTSTLAVRIPKQQVCMSLTTDVAMESRVSSLIKLRLS
jgi:glucose-1-phosphate adenylyltransferase